MYYVAVQQKFFGKVKFNFLLSEIAFFLSQEAKYSGY